MSLPQKLMIFAKAPEAGRVKTRLQLSGDDAAALHGAFVLDVIERHKRPERVVTVWRTGDLEHVFWTDLEVALKTQSEGTLGDRLAEAFCGELTSGSSVVVLGTDSPTLPPALVDAAFAALDEVTCVIGPACDGGYYLLGMRGEVAPVFLDDMRWGTEEVLPRTLKALEESGTSHRVLDFWYDVDRPADLALMCAHMPVLRRTGIPLPRRALTTIEERHLTGPNPL